MAKRGIAAGTVHGVPADLRKALAADASARGKWEDITQLARNEWICWTISVKNPATRENHLQRTIAELKEGKRRPCCWMGCIHRTDKAVSPSVRAILNRRSKKK